MSKHGFFITGTDTGCGKTHVSAALIAHLQSSARTVAGIKPIASGFEERGGVLLNEDVEAIRAVNKGVLPEHYLNRYAFEPAIAPHIAADKAGRVIDLSQIKHDVEASLTLVDTLIIEGVGGWRVPLRISPYEDIQSLAETLNMPVILVVGLKLGCLNHALLTAESISRADVPFAGWVANHIDPNYDHVSENIETLTQKMPVPKLFEVPFLSESDKYGKINQLSKAWASTLG